MDNEIDRIETMILMALDANHNAALGEQSSVSKRSRQSVARVCIDVGELLPLSVMKPKSAYTVDSSAERLYARGSEYLTAHPAEILRDEEEGILLCDDKLKWIGCRKLPRAPKNCSVLGKPSHWYELHFRNVFSNGVGYYGRRVVPFSKTGEVLPVFTRGVSVCDPNIDGASLVLLASIKEDAHRAGAMLAEVKDATEIKFPVSLGDYKSVFAERDGPYIGARRKAIIHWVAAHLRTRSGETHEVKKHVRGIQEFSIDGLRVRITANTGGFNG